MLNDLLFRQTTIFRFVQSKLKREEKKVHIGFCTGLPQPCAIYQSLPFKMRFY